MNKTISSRTPEGVPNHCPVCDTIICVEPSQPPGDAPCPSCGVLLWFFETSAGIRFHESEAVAPLRDQIIETLCEKFGVNRERIDPTSSFSGDVGADSLDVVELVMELEEKLDIVIPDDDAETIKTVGDAIDYLAKRNL
jgi:acyl carrier protein